MRGERDVVFGLLVVQAALGLLGMVGAVLFMGSGLYVVGSVLKAAGLLVLGALVLRGRRWALVALLVVEWVALFGGWVGLALGVLPGLTPSVTLTGLLTGVGLPVAVGWLCARQLTTTAQPTVVLR